MRAVRRADDLYVHNKYTFELLSANNAAIGYSCPLFSTLSIRVDVTLLRVVTMGVTSLSSSEYDKSRSLRFSLFASVKSWPVNTNLCCKVHI